MKVLLKTILLIIIYPIIVALAILATYLVTSLSVSSKERFSAYEFLSYSIVYAESETQLGKPTVIDFDGTEGGYFINLGNGVIILSNNKGLASKNLAITPENGSDPIVINSQNTATYDLLIIMVVVLVVYLVLIIVIKVRKSKKKKEIKTAAPVRITVQSNATGIQAKSDLGSFSLDKAEDVEVRWAYQLAIRNDAEAQYTLAVYFSSGYKTVPADQKQAIYWLERAASLHYPKAIRALEAFRRL